MGNGKKVSKRHVKGMSTARPSKLQTTMSKGHVKGMYVTGMPW